MVRGHAIHVERPEKARGGGPANGAGQEPGDIERQPDLGCGQPGEVVALIAVEVPGHEDIEGAKDGGPADLPAQQARDIERHPDMLVGQPGKIGAVVTIEVPDHECIEGPRQWLPGLAIQHNPDILTCQPG
jgi:hypothetical protein